MATKMYTTAQTIICFVAAGLCPLKTSQAFAPPVSVAGVTPFGHSAARMRGQAGVEKALLASASSPPGGNQDSSLTADNNKGVDGDDDYTYAEYLDIKNRRRAIRQSTAFDEVAAVDFERMVQLMEKDNFAEGDKVFTQGDKPDALYFISSGTFDCYEESTGIVKATLGRFDVLGELGLLMDQPRALSARATSPDASAWKLDRKDFAQIVSRDTKMGAVAALEDQEEYREYFDLLSLRKALKSCKIFKNLAPRDTNDVIERMKKVQVNAGEVMIEEGTNGDSMYFVVDGVFECFQAKDGKVLKVCEKGSYFGELGLFFQTPRRLSVKATMPSTAWMLKREDFFAAVQETSIDPEALEILQNSYKQGQFIDFDEIYQFLVIKSRPKKKPVSFHSTFSIFSAGVWVSSLVPFLKPGIDDRGLPAFLRLNEHSLTAAASQQFQVGCWLLAITGFLGLFRFPPNTPTSRKLIFENAVFAGVFEATFLSSSLNAQPPGYWWFDAFSVPGTIAITLTMLPFYITALNMLDDFIAGSDRGRETISGADNPLLAVVLYSVLYAFAPLLLIPAVPIFASDLASYEANVRDVFAASDLGGVLMGPVYSAAGIGAIGSLFSTLQFEKKITPLTGNILTLILLVALTFDGLVFLINILLHPDKYGVDLDVVNTYYATQFSQTHFWELALALPAIVVLNAIRKKVTGVQNK